MGDYIEKILKRIEYGWAEQADALANFDRLVYVRL
jgi:hypothetical protein